MTDTSLLAWLETLDDDALTALLVARSDVLRGAPVRDLEDLAQRLVQPTSVAEVLLEQPLPLVQTLAPLAACGAGAGVARIASLLDPAAAEKAIHEHVDLVARCVDALTHVGLVWPNRAQAGTPDSLVVNPGLHAVLPDPLGAGRPATQILREIPADSLKRVLRAWGREVPGRKDELVAAVASALADPAHVRGVVATAPESVSRYLVERVRALADRFRSARLPQPAWDDVLLEEDVDDLSPAFDVAAYRAEQTALTWARGHGMAFSPYGELAAYGPVGVELPSEVVLALLGADVVLPFDPVPPALLSAPVDAAQARGAAAAAVTETVALAMAVLETIDRQPLTTLKSGGVGSRELARLAKQLGAPPRSLRLVLELTAAIGLLEPGPGARLGTGTLFGDWRRLDPGERAAELVRTWLEAPIVPGTERDPEGKTLAVLGNRELSMAAPLVRATLLDEVRSLDGRGVAASEALVDLVLWRLPYAGGPQAREEIRTTWSEAASLGLVGLGAVSDAGRAASADDGTLLVRELARMLPPTQRSALFGSDLTVVVAGSPAAAVVDLLDAVADREAARGSAATWRFTPQSVRRALDDGHEPDELLARLEALARDGLPQALQYLVRDVARRHGHVGVQSAGSVVLGEDAALLAEIQAHRSLRRLALRQVAPTVLVAAAGPQEVLLALRQAGYLPVPLDEDGAPTVTVSRTRDAGAAADPPEPPLDDADLALRRWAAEMAAEREHPAADAAAKGEQPADVARRLREGGDVPGDGAVDQLAAEIRAFARRLSDVEVRHLAHAVRHRAPVQLRYRSASGAVTVRVVSQLTLRGGYLYGWCHLRQDERFFALGSILTVATA